MDSSIDILGKEADDLAKSAEAKHYFTLLTKSNALRLKVAQQSQEIPRSGERTQRAKGKVQEPGVNSTIYSAALPFICEIKTKI